MTHMIAYLAGDSDTMATRAALTEDIRLAVDFVGEQRMLLVSVMQNGDVTMTWTPSQGTGQVHEMYLVGKVTPIGNTPRHTFEINPTPTMIPVKDGVRFSTLQPKP